MPTGTLVVVIRQGPDRVPFHPKLARIQQANTQLASILGHSIQIELDGSLLPQTEDGAEDVIARLVEDVARDIDALDKTEREFAKKNFEKLVVRYSPSEAAKRETRWQRSVTGKLDVATKTIDVPRAEAGWIALERGEIASVLARAEEKRQDDRYADVLPDSLPRNEYRPWFEYHDHGLGRAPKVARVGSLDPTRVRGMVMLYGLAKRVQDDALVKDVRKWLVHAMDEFSSAYHHEQNAVESAPPSSPFKVAEAAYVDWVKRELPNMSLDEREQIVRHLWVIDFRKQSGDRFATYAFPGLDPMAVGFAGVDAWLAAGHPQQKVHPYFDFVVCPAVVDDHDGHPKFNAPGRCDGELYRWSFADRNREDAFVKNFLARPDPTFALAVFYNARRTLHEESDYLRFLRRFEVAPALWNVGADVHREVVYRPSAEMLEEARRHYRDVPFARGDALFWFARHIDGSYHPDTDWPDLIQGKPADEAAFAQYLDLGWEAFQLLPAVWQGLAKNGARVRTIVPRAQKLMGMELRPEAGGRGVPGVLMAVARKLCEDRSLGELAELRAFAQSELPKRPGAGMSEVVEETDPSKCSNKAAPRTPPPKSKPKTPPVPLKPGDFNDPPTGEHSTTGGDR